MEDIYAYLKNVWQNLKQENSKNPSLIFIILVLCSIPLGYALNSISIALLLLVSLLSFKKNNFKIEKNLLFPIILFLLMAVSLIWTRDFNASIKSLSKGLPLIIIPISFFLFPALNPLQKNKIIQWYSYGMLLFSLFCLIKAVVRYLFTHDSSVFFYHQLVTEDVNAIHVSVYIALALIYYITKSTKHFLDNFAIVLLLIFLLLLSSKNILIVFFVLIGFYFLRNFKSIKKHNLLLAIIFVVGIGFLIFNGKISNRFQTEYQSNVTEKVLKDEDGRDNSADNIYYVNVDQAWSQDQFQANNYFSGTALRIYQVRIFTEMLQEDPIFFTGYGLNATDEKIKQKRIEHNLYPGYENFNFHNEYIQIFAELGIFGLLLIITILTINVINAIKNKDFIHISFAVLMISLFLTESFLSRQRGIIFFTVMYCVFNSGINMNAPKKRLKKYEKNIDYRCSGFFRFPFV